MLHCSSSIDCPHFPKREYLLFLFLSPSLSLSLSYLYGINIILIQSKIWIITAIERRHQSALDVAVAKTERVAELVRCNLEEIRATITAHSPSFGIVKVRIATVDGKVSMCQGTARSIKRIAVTVLTHFEPDLNVNLKES